MTGRSVKRAPADLREMTAARVSLPMSGHSLATEEVLEFQLAHAQARDAVHATLHLPSFERRLREELEMLAERSIAIVSLRSQAADRASYLRHPQLGRALDAESAALLQPTGCELAVTIADGLSTLAIVRNAIPLLAVLLPRLATEGWTIAPLTLVQQGRVGICDAIGEGLGVRCSLMLIGERPGLSAADSMGAYLTWEPRVGRTDAERNCISNIRSGGLGVEAAAGRLIWLLQTARVMGQTGVALKEGSTASLIKR